MALIIFSGWEWGMLGVSFNSEGTYDNGPALSIVSGAWAGSTYSIRMNPVGAAVADYNFSGVGPSGSLAVTSVPNSFHRFDFKYEVKPAANDEPIIRMDNVGAAATMGYITLNSSGVLSVRNRLGALVQTGTTVLAQGTKYTIYWKIGVGSSGPYEVRINSSTAPPELSGTADFGTVNCGEIRIGKATNLNSQTVDFYFDNYAWRDDFYPPPGICVALLPVADGFYANGSPNGAAQLWQCIDSIPSNIGTTYINGLAQGQAYVAQIGPAVSGIINYAMPFMSFARDNVNVAATCQLRLRSGTTDADTVTPTGGVANYVVRRNLFETDPNTGLPWTPTGINAAQVGLTQSAAGAVRFTNALVMVDYLPSVPVSPIPLAGVYSQTTGLRNVLGTSPVPSY